ncbi:MotA/TolQ/ExbB proton channel family protein [Roseobacter denitrificans]|uniref:MotA/TolQ/ExbB proton channel family domain protein n=1 Tax=Roseobacter denitrificans (strain ATCC 33942 / OCh 114) TaxID=375451 RepID=Q160F9_ROSDO|nr:MotA/TolQ/ExbB proton channel family protein [Roseobacter denitrificans]ABG33634.1 MotA/TolQ/ExbB proton channel family domain protein [Roseobacter denitrificans OCh 114]AVL52931.1 MotA/TolQ/ExbB proton channel family protein [Roseobacter denitrificans]SFG03322.1 outer membrane transport energization protein ExbB [Roseobacter denitrificans OCh 114]
MTDAVSAIRQSVWGIFDLGGPVVMLLLCLSIVALAVTLYKVWQHRVARVGRHDHIRSALRQRDANNPAAALTEVRASTSHLAPLIEAALKAPGDAIVNDRLVKEAAANLSRLEGGYRILDSIAQISPLLGLFGTVLGMIDAFRALQEAGAAVDPSLLAGGIWVALLTTAVGLAVAIPTSLVLTWLEGRTSRERDFAELALARARAPMDLRNTQPAASLADPAHA